MAFLLIHLHGKRADSLSNQMRQTKAMSPLYAIKWWREHGLKPPELDSVEFLLKRLAWRYAKGRPSVTDGRMYLGDSTRVLPRIRSSGHYAPVRLLLTSPPYYGVTNYHYDQWLRLWLLGGPPTSKGAHGLHRGKFEGKQQYRKLLLDVFASAKGLLRRDSVVYVRTDKRSLTLNTTVDVLRQVFPKHRLYRRSQPYLRPTQTQLFGHAEPRIGEVDLILRSSRGI